MMNEEHTPLRFTLYVLRFIKAYSATPFVMLLVIILTAFFLRVWQLPHVPPGLWYDEAYNAMDALWMTQTGQYQLFMVGNNGREPLWHYLLLLSLTGLGRSAFAVRWVGAVVGVLTVPVMYRLARLLLGRFVATRREVRWLAVAAAGWVAVSWWHLHLSRSGLRPVLLPLIMGISLYFFWQGVSAIGEQTLRRTPGLFRFPQAPLPNFILAGFFLGITQYTYLSARLTPLIFGGLVLLWTLPVVVAFKKAPVAAIGRLWIGLLLTGFAAAVVFAPLGFYFLNNPDAFSSRTGDVFFFPRNPVELGAHLWQGVTFFWGAGHQLYRHHLPGRAMLGWLEIPFFWIGLLALLRPANLRCPETHLLWVGLGIMWLPALLASPPVHSLRPVGMLPFYYLMVTLGLYYAVHFTFYVLRKTPSLQTPGYLALFPAAAVVVIALNGLINTYDYFVRWANTPEVYQEYNGPLVDLLGHIRTLTRTQDVIIPLHVYVHPTTRFILGDDFPEQAGPPPLPARPAQMALLPGSFQLLYVGNIPDSPAMVRLTRDAAGRGAAYMSRPPRMDEQLALDHLLARQQSSVVPFKDKLGRTVAQFAPLSVNDQVSAIQGLFNTAPLRAVNLAWDAQVQLTGYDVTPALVQPGQPIYLNLYWRSLTNTAFEHTLFLQLIDAAGNPVNQWEGSAFNEDMYRWRPHGLLPTRHPLWVGPNTPPGPYLVRLGFFDEATGRRLPLQMGESANERVSEAAPPPSTSEKTAIDQVQLGLFYVTADSADPRHPAQPLSATFADAIQLIGVTLPDLNNNQLKTQNSARSLPLGKLKTVFHWQALHPTNQPYTVFLQLLNEQGQVVSGWDSQPFGGLYPTNLWSPGEVVVDTFNLPLPEGGLPPGSYRLITGFYDVDTGARLPASTGADFADLAQFTVPAP
jgi:hypothetical protein